MREDMCQPGQDFWMLLKKYGELGMNENVWFLKRALSAYFFVKIYERGM